MTDTRELVERLNATLGGVTVPDLMHGDNLAITLCTAYDNPDQDTDEETGWTPDAISGQEAVLAAIRAHYAPLADTITALSERVRVLEGAVNWLDALLALIEDTSCDPDDEERFDETMMGARLALKAARAALAGGRG